MISLRSLTRSVPRAAAQMSRSAIRRPAQPCAVLRSSWMPARPQLAAAFSTSHLRPAKSGEVDDELVAKFESEIQAELEMRDAEEVPTSIKEFLDNGPWEIQDTPGQEEVVLTRAYGAETVRVTFSIADLNNLDPEADFEDRALADEEDMDDNINQGSKDFKVAPEDSIAAADGEEGELEEQPESFPVRVNVTVEKAGKGALSVESMAQDGQIVIDNVYYFTDAELAYSKSAEKAHAAQEQYVGPPFGNLDEDLQVLLERYLDERGINTALALFVPDYIDMKEQKEYVTWLLNVKSFVES